MANETGTSERQYWLWVTRPEFYADAEGREREDLDPAIQRDAGDWWTCHKDTRRGDLVFLWRTTPRSDIRYLFEVTSDAYSIMDEPEAREYGWNYGCDFQVRYKFDESVTASELREHEGLSEWSPLLQKFRRRAFRLAPPDWRRLAELLSQKNPGFREQLRTLGTQISQQIVLEEELEKALAADLSILRPHGYELASCERQYSCRGHGGRIDLLCQDARQDAYVVVELKNVIAGQNAFGQISTYLGWVEANLRKRIKPRGLLIARGFDPRFISAAKTNPRVAYLTLADIGFE